MTVQHTNTFGLNVLQSKFAKLINIVKITVHEILVAFWGPFERVFKKDKSIL
jgi:hypothetical protein